MYLRCLDFIAHHGHLHGERKHTSAAEPAADLDVSSHEMDELACDRKTQAGPTLTTPALNARVNGYGPLMAWSAAPGAINYRFERRPAGGGNVVESVWTTAQSYAPTSVIPCPT